ncbi:hypothetical protein [Phenylobacterium sp.]|uniref:hypothetical protein n=1 Tax=Phenylobacterium sp. TaxID=1871053 RepID=UPI0030F3EF1A
MRALITVLVFTSTFVGPALAQEPSLNAGYEAMWQEQQAANQMARQRSVALENQRGALEALMQTETRLRTLEVQGAAPPRADPSASTIAAPSDIDAWIAESNARIRAASANRR